MHSNVTVARVAAGIRFGNYIFSEPVPLTHWSPPRVAGLYAVLLPDFTWAPRTFQPLYFGELGPNPEAQLTPEEYTCWFRAAAGKNLYVSVTFTTPSDRATIRDELLRAYSPLCHRPSAGSEAVTRRLDDLERKARENDALLRAMLTAFGRFLEPQPESPHPRRIGFAPTNG